MTWLNIEHLSANGWSMVERHRHFEHTGVPPPSDRSHTKILYAIVSSFATILGRKKMVVMTTLFATTSWSTEAGETTCFSPTPNFYGQDDLKVMKHALRALTDRIYDSFDVPPLDNF